MGPNRVSICTFTGAVGAAWLVAAESICTFTGAVGAAWLVAAESQPDADMNKRATAVNNVAVKKVEVDKRICAFFIIFEV